MLIHIGCGFIVFIPSMGRCVRQVLQFGFHDSHEVNRCGAGALFK